jgi:hypothetical protein
MIRKAHDHYARDGVRRIEARTTKNFNSGNFLRDLEQKHWSNIYCSEDPNKMWEIWKSMLIETVDKHAPLKIRRISERKSPWIIRIRREIFNRVYFKKKAVSTNDPEVWHQYRQARNQTNNASALILLKILSYIDAI